jgi:hypothetical protein
VGPNFSGFNVFVLSVVGDVPVVTSSIFALLVWFISHQTTLLFSRNKPIITNQPAVLFSQNKPAPAISHQPNEQAA